MESKIFIIGSKQYDLGLPQKISEQWDAQHFGDKTIYLSCEMAVLGNKQGEAAMEDAGEFSLIDALMGSKYVQAKLTLPFTDSFVKNHKGEMDQAVETLAGVMTSINLKGQEGMSQAQIAGARTVAMQSMACKMAKAYIVEHGMAFDGDSFSSATKKVVRSTGVSKVVAKNQVVGSMREPISASAANDLVQDAEKYKREKVIDIISAQGATTQAKRRIASAAGLKKIPIYTVKQKALMESYVEKLMIVMDQKQKEVKDYSEEIGLTILKELPTKFGVEPVKDRVMAEYTKEEEETISKWMAEILKAYTAV